MSKNTLTIISEVNSATTHVVAFVAEERIELSHSFWSEFPAYETGEAYQQPSSPQYILKNVLFHSSLFVARTGYDPVTSWL